MPVLKYKDTGTWKTLQAPVVVPGTRYTCAYRRAAQHNFSIDGWELIKMDTLMYDEGSAYDMSTGIWTAPATGLVRFSGNLQFLVNPGGVVSTFCSIEKMNPNNTPQVEIIRGDILSASVTAMNGLARGVTGLWPVVAGEKYSLYGYLAASGLSKYVWPEIYCNRFEVEYVNLQIVPVVTSQWTTWADLPLAAGFVWFGAPFDRPQWRKSSWGEYQIRGLCSGTNAGAIVTSLAGGKPGGGQMIQPIKTQTGVSRIDIADAGGGNARIDISEPLITGWFSLGGVSWSTI